MDYSTHSISRKKLRQLAPIFRSQCKEKTTGAFPVLHVLEKLPEIFNGCNYEIVEDEELPANTMAECSRNDNPDGYTIKIKKSVYNGAYEHNNGACLGFICHELCHIFLFNIGFTPIHARSFDDNELIPCRSVEWQAKALAGEVMIPYDESKGMLDFEIISKYHVSKGFAKYRLRLK